MKVSILKVSQEFTFKNIDETKNYFIEEMSENKMTSNKRKKVCKVLNYIEKLLILVSTVTGCGSISVFTSLVAISIVTTSSAIGFKICAITAEIKKRNNMKNTKKHDKIEFLAKDKLNT